MQISSDYVGRRCTPLELTIDARDAMNYAAAVGDANPRYLDDTQTQGIIAPPMLAVALTWRISRDFASFWRASDFPSEVLQQQVHYIEALRWNHLMRPGTHLVIEGEVKAILPHRAGTLLLIEYRAINGAGEAVFSESIGGMLRGVTCMDDGRGRENVPVVPRARANAKPIWEKRLHIGPLDAHIYDGCADIHFPIHTSPAFAARVGLPGTIYHGTATLSQALREITNREAKGDPARLRGVSCSFTGTVPLDTNVTVQTLERTEGDEETEIHFQVLNQDGKKAVRGGVARIGHAR